MTREEAISILERIDICANAAETARDMAIAALREQEEQKATLIQQYIKVPEKPRWISVEERLPEKSVPVLAYKDGRIWYCERNWQSGCWESLSFAATKEYGMYWSKGPTHWMPLPELPTKEE